MVKRFLSFALGLALIAGVVAPASAQNFSSVQVLNGSCAAPAFTFHNDSDSGFYLVSAGTIAICINGAEVGRINSNGIQSNVSGAPVAIKQSTGQVLVNTSSYADADSFQAVAGDLNLAAGAGTSTAGDSAYLVGIMGNVLRTGNLTDTENFVGGVLGKYDITGTNASTYAKGAVIAEIGGATAGSTPASADGAFVAVLGGDAGPVRARAAYTVDFATSHSSANAATPAYFNFGLDLQGGGTHSSYTTPRFQDGYIRMGGLYNNAGTLEEVTDFCILAGTAAPSNGTSGTGAGQCGAGSLYSRQAGASSTLHQNTGTKASPTWTAK